MAVGDGAGLCGSLDLLQEVDFGQIAEGGGLHWPKPLYFNP
jgi:hypothetical protein